MSLLVLIKAIETPWIIDEELNFNKHILSSMCKKAAQRSFNFVFW